MRDFGRAPSRDVAIGGVAAPIVIFKFARKLVKRQPYC